MTSAALLALVFVGCGVGFLAGLVGIGGGVLIVPFLYFFYAHAGWSGVALPTDLQAPVAHATSLLIIVPTAIAGTMTYARNGLVAWRVALPIALFSMGAAAVAAIFATRMPPELLKVVFGVFLVFASWQLVAGRGKASAGPQRSSIVAAAATGVLIGVFSALLGVGGGVVAIPLLMYLIRLDIKYVAATSLAVVLFAASAGTVTYMVRGADVMGLPWGHIGYVHIAAALPMLPGAILGARWGARVNQRLDAGRLHWIFAALFTLVGIQLIVRNLPLLFGQ